MTVGFLIRSYSTISCLKHFLSHKNKLTLVKISIFAEPLSLWHFNDSTTAPTQQYLTAVNKRLSKMNHRVRAFCLTTDKSSFIARTIVGCLRLIYHTAWLLSASNYNVRGCALSELITFFIYTQKPVFLDP